MQGVVSWSRYPGTTSDKSWSNPCIPALIAVVQVAALMLTQHLFVCLPAVPLHWAIGGEEAKTPTVMSEATDDLPRGATRG